MCGINGATAAIKVVDDMNAVTRHRGPDDQGSLSVGSIVLGMNRLAIVETGAPGHQPMQTEDGRYTLVFNGEIYNHQELREKLLMQGIRCHSQSDTEVLLRGLAVWGASFIDQLRGMWAFCLHDQQLDTLFLSRDPFGIKPLYLFHQGTTIAFSSEVRGLLACPLVPRQLNAKAVQQVLGLGYILSPQTILQNVDAFLPGEERVIELKTGQTKRLVRTLQALVRQAPSDDELEAVLSESVKRHLAADVPVGVFYSGGVDSSLLAILARRHHADVPLYHLAIEGRADTAYARKIIDHLEWKNVIELSFTPDESPSWWEKYQQSLDQPLADTAFLPLLVLATRAHQDVKVALSGEGGDELFAGYPRQQRYGMMDFSDTNGVRQFSLDRVVGALGYRAELKRVYEGARRHLAAWRHDPVESFLYETVLGGGVVDLTALHEQILKKIDTVKSSDQGLALDRSVYLPDDLLMKLDVATMATSLEGRVPFLDRAVFAAVGGAPFVWKNAAGQNKLPLKRLLKRFLPAELVDRKKSGFSLPLASYFLSQARIRPAIDWYLGQFSGVNPRLDELFQQLQQNRLPEARIKVAYGHLLFGLIICHGYAERFHL